VRAQLETRLGALLAGRTCVVYDSDADRSSPAWQAAALRAALQPALGQLLEGRVQPLRHYLHPLRCARLPQLLLRLHSRARRDRRSALRRWVKSPAELALLRRSAAASAAAMARCIQLTRPGVSEAFIAATFGAHGAATWADVPLVLACQRARCGAEYECRMRGAQQMAYPQVVGAGADACTIHYSRNDKVPLARACVTQ
jgi:Xaa-Pro aminopeptidase